MRESQNQCRGCELLRAELVGARSEINHLRQMLQTAALLVSTCDTRDPGWIDLGDRLVDEVREIRNGAKPWSTKPRLG